ncbi:MAG: TRL-like family protein [Saprospiraceae bacterium]|nr:TRL-like family protein [Saprospiraceae bacterium]MCB0627109.1 TRL-like family protein [Saprospiraceae bacterium]MCB0677605.1 TRL-like family protein [Saprospiraceae bacterium]MCB0683220.1 TRL-like family protein [Saprospiraceae bacterium]
MKNLLLLSAIAFILSSCGAFVSTPAVGWLYTDVQAPYQATSNPVASKVGTAEITSILGIVATGDASIEAAARKAGISKISHVDYHAKSILGIFATFTIYVYGE